MGLPWCLPGQGVLNIDMKLTGYILIPAVAALGIFFFKQGIFPVSENEQPSAARNLPFLYERIEYASSSFDVATVKKGDISKINFYSANNSSPSIRGIGDLQALAQKDGKELLFATNGGIFDTSVVPLGLYVERGVEIHALNEESGDGNFHMQPNGVFAIDESDATIVASPQYKPTPVPIYALQSGPLLVIDNEINPSFNHDSDNTYIRSGVGITENGDVVFAISNNPVSFFAFAELFKNQIGAPNALYLDGFISKMYVLGQRKDTDGLFATLIAIME